MSLGKKFSKKEPMSDAERLDEIERKYGVIQERIQAYDAVLNENAQLKKRLSALERDDEDLFKNMRNLSDSANRHDLKIQELFDRFSRREVVIDQEIRKASDAISANHAVGMANKTAIDRFAKALDNKIKEAIGPLAFSKDLQEFRSQHVDDIAGVKGNHRSLEMNVEKIMLDIQALFQAQRESDSTDQFLASNLAAVSNTFEKVKAEFEKRVAFTERTIANTWDSIRTSLQEDLKKAKIELMGSPSSLASTKQEILGKLEATTLDGNNAMLMVRNFADQIKLLEKKIESLGAQIKRIEISK